MNVIDARVIVHGIQNGEVPLVTSVASRDAILSAAESMGVSIVYGRSALGFHMMAADPVEIRPGRTEVIE